MSTHHPPALRSVRHVAFVFLIGVIAVAWLCAQPALAVRRVRLVRADGQAHASIEEIDQAIKKAQEYLYSQQKADGGWEDTPLVRNARGMQPGLMGQYGGASAAATYALLCSGQKSSDPRLAKAVRFLKSIDIHGVYALGLRCQVWNQLYIEIDPKDYNRSDAARELRMCVAHDAELLIKGMKQRGVASGMFTYTTDDPDGSRYDHSCSNYGAMGVWACAQAGLDIPRGFWKVVEDGWKAHQNADGGWAYTANVPASTLTMTTGGLVNLFITQEYLDLNRGADCKPVPPDNHIEAAIQWLAQNKNNRSGYYFYELFNLQRVGAESGSQCFGDWDWYQDNADQLVHTQQANGAWEGNGAQGIAYHSFGLAFLALGRAPVVMNKLQYGLDKSGAKPKWGNWNLRPRDAANIVHWMERRVHRRLNWQIVTLDMSMETLRQSPILYICGNETLNLTAAQRDRLRDYILQGGMVIANADCGGKKFASSMIDLGEAMFPMYTFRPLPKDHPVYADELYPVKDKKKFTPILALGNQAREFFLLFPEADPGKAWQQLPLAHSKQETLGVTPKEDLYEIAANIYYYASEKAQLRDKNQTYIIASDPAQAKKKATIAQIEYDGNWNPEPFGWTQLSNHLRNEHQIEIDIKAVKLGQGQLDSRYPIAYLTGTAKLKLSDAQKEELRRFGYEGGVIIVDACGGSDRFSTSAEEQLKQIFGQDLEPLPADHPVFSCDSKIKEVKYRERALKKLGADFKAPLLKGITQDNKLKVVFSPLDLSVALVGQPIDCINGYAPESAIQIMTNIIVLSLPQGQ